MFVSATACSTVPAGRFSGGRPALAGPPRTQKTPFTGKAGTLVIVSVGRSFELGFGTAGNWSGTWSVVGGTGTYAGMRGHGTWVGADNLNHLSLQARFAGVVTQTP